MSGTAYSGTAGTIRAGVVSATVNGESIEVSGDATYAPVRWKREALIGQSGLQGFSKTFRTGMISFSVRDAGSLTVQAFNEMDSANVVLQLANGKTVYGDGLAETSDNIEVNSADGTFKLQFEGTVTEVTA